MHHGAATAGRWSQSGKHLPRNWRNTMCMLQRLMVRATGCSCRGSGWRRTPPCSCCVTAAPGRTRAHAPCLQSRSLCWTGTRPPRRCRCTSAPTTGLAACWARCTACPSSCGARTTSSRRRGGGATWASWGQRWRCRWSLAASSSAWWTRCTCSAVRAAATRSRPLALRPWRIQRLAQRGLWMMAMGASSRWAMSTSITSSIGYDKYPLTDVSSMRQAAGTKYSRVHVL
mmetsp:Transcript_34566/g.87413  ORF Transcript_34566/g.87413 Transcript_34566/m.87413 type:complete len:229 (-) Transcript_34566:202-888(-)